MKPYLTILFFLGFCRFYAQMPTLDLEGYWPFHGNAYDSSGNFNDGIINNAVLTQDRFGNCNEAYRFNGLNTSIVVPNATAIDMDNSTDFTIAFWIKTDINNANGIPLSKNTFGSISGYQFFTNLTGSGYCNSVKHISFYVAAGGNQDACSNNAIDTNWHFITGVYNNIPNQGFIYIDGVVQTDIGQRYANVSTLSDLVFGANTGFGEHFNGVLDAIRIYRRALTLSEILELYNEASPATVIGSSDFLKDTTVCASSVNLNAGTATSYTWSTGSHTQSINVGNSGTFWATIENSNGCKQTDTVHVTIVSPANYNVIKDTVACSNSGVLLNATQSNATNYNWSTGESTTYIIGYSTGIYWVDMQIGICTIRDSAQVNLSIAPFLNLANDTILCSTPISLKINDTTLYVTWWDGSHSSQIIVSNNGDYYVTAFKNGCMFSDTIHVSSKESNFNDLIPNVFTPNGDGANDFFELKTANITVNDLRIYNRWGKLVYSTQNIVKWDGRQANGIVDDGTYYWVASFLNGCDNSKIDQKGFLTIFK